MWLGSLPQRRSPKPRKFRRAAGRNGPSYARVARSAEIRRRILAAGRRVLGDFDKHREKTTRASARSSGFDDLGWRVVGASATLRSAGAHCRATGRRRRRNDGGPDAVLSDRSRSRALSVRDRSVRRMRRGCRATSLGRRRLGVVVLNESTSDFGEAETGSRRRLFSPGRSPWREGSER